MTTLMSRIESISCCFIERMPKTRKIKVVRAVRFGDRDVVFETANGTLYTNNRSLGGRTAMICGGYGFEKDMLKALVALGRVTQEERDAHIEYYTARRLEKDKTYALENLERTAKEYGFKITKAQRAALSPKKVKEPCQK